jgi:hypothetical protein
LWRGSWIIGRPDVKAEPFDRRELLAEIDRIVVADRP